MPDMMTVPGIWLWGLLATGLLTTILRLGQAFHFTRIDMPFLLGTMFTANRDRAKVIGFVFHFLNGWAFAFLYAVFFKQVGFATWWLGGLMGISHGVFVLVVLLPLLPSGHPRMASEFHGPEVTMLLEPPGFLALHYGYQTPMVTMLAHLGYGIVLGALYRP